MVDIELENVVVSAHLLEEVNLKEISQAIPDSKYDPDEFPGVSMLLDYPRVAVIILASGKVVCTGAKSLEEAKDAIGILIKRLKEHGFKVNESPKINVQNVVASANLGKEIDFEKVKKNVGEKVEYIPEEFPGLIYKHPNTTVLLFKSGKIVCTGGINEREVKESIEKVVMEIS